MQIPKKNLSSAHSEVPNCTLSFKCMTA